MYLAEQGLFIFIATILWAADIRAQVDEDGNAIMPSSSSWDDNGIATYTTIPFCAIDHGSVLLMPTYRNPSPFSCTVTPRFAGAQAILEEALSAM